MSARFDFGANWLRFAATIGPEQIVEAQRSLSRLLDRNDLSGASFLDIGCGSGLFSLAARNMGARVRSFDVDVGSVACTQALRDRYYPNDGNWVVERGSILDLGYVQQLRAFDVVYSWGVLHHTGAMWQALEHASAKVAPSGVLAVALYRRTPLCRAWQIEKRFYASAPPWVQLLIRAPYMAALLAGKIVQGKNPVQVIRSYKSDRGMDWYRNVHDWLGGFPYESARAEAVKSHLKRLGFRVVRSFERPPGIGLLGTGCDEFVGQKLAQE
jgi:2-polyprenyl-6-hydroxyphenyl methylase/3-demethylubiquinone-9 3-methyltransferase